MKAKAARSGFTLMEMIVALCLSAFVIIGVVGVATQMIRFHMESDAKNGVTSWNLLAMTYMNQEIQGSSTLYCPFDPSQASAHSGDPGCTATTSDVLSSCNNWSIQQSSVTGNGEINTSAGASVTAYYYCVTNVNSIPSLLRYCRTSLAAASAPPGCTGGFPVASACPYKPAPTCGAGNYVMVAQNIQRLNGLPYFTRADDVGGVRLRYTVGSSTATAQVPMPRFSIVDTKIGIGKSYTDKQD